MINAGFMRGISSIILTLLSAAAMGAVPPLTASTPESAALQYSLKFAKQGYPKTLFKAPWLPTKDRQGLLRKSAIKPFKFAYAMVVSALYDARADQQGLSWKWLEDYECENLVACTQFLDFFDSALKTHPFHLKDSDLARARRIEKRARLKAEALAEVGPDPTGICTLGASRDRWIAMAYELYCPSSQAELEAVKNLVEISSHQLLLSSTHVEDFKQVGKPNCDTPWKVDVVCGGDVQREFHLKCAREEASYPPSVHCEELQ